ncbi:MAG: bacterioferritin-associated ferredoxin [Alphaproteobacteria bacterium]
MIVCVCNALGERQCREVAARPETRDAGCVYRQLGCRVRCGACMATMRDIVNHVRRDHAALEQAQLSLAED